MTSGAIWNEVRIPSDGVTLAGDLIVPQPANGLVLFAHGSGSSRMSPRNREVAATLTASGRFATLLFDLLTPHEDQRPENRFDIGLLAERLVAATEFALATPEVGGLKMGYFGASTGAAAAIRAATMMPEAVHAVVSRGGRPDLAEESLSWLFAPTLFIVGGFDAQVLTLNQDALERIPARDKSLAVVDGATHLFEEPGAIAQVAEHAQAWFTAHLAGAG